jgi:hypothetical protein
MSADFFLKIREEEFLISVLLQSPCPPHTTLGHQYFNFTKSVGIVPVLIFHGLFCSILAFK